MHAQTDIRAYYSQCIRALAKANGRLHGLIWSSDDAGERMAMRRETEANARRMREAEYLARYFLAHPDEFTRCEADL